LAIKYDFNTYDAFKIFDNIGLGYIQDYSFKAALSDIGVFATHDDIALFFKRYDVNHDGKIRYSEFCNAIVPNDPYHATLVNRRPSNNIRTSYYKDDVFTAGTRLFFKDLLKTTFSVER